MRFRRHRLCFRLGERSSRKKSVAELFTGALPRRERLAVALEEALGVARHQEIGTVKKNPACFEKVVDGEEGTSSNFSWLFGIPSACSDLQTPVGVADSADQT
ncbi:hypothetical protein ACFX2J_042456 [Malus domestica]